MDKPQTLLSRLLVPPPHTPPHSVRSGLCKEACQCWDTLAPWPAAGRRPLRDACCLALSSESSRSPRPRGLGRFPFKAAKLSPLMQLVSWRPSKHSEGAFAVVDSGLDRAYLGVDLMAVEWGFCPGRGLLRSLWDSCEFSCGPLWSCGSCLGPSEATVVEADGAGSREGMRQVKFRAPS